jgi:hypothetical protein
VRLGRLLGEARQTSGESLEDLTRRCGLAYDAEFFAEVEAGHTDLDEWTVRWLTDLYGIEAGLLVPARSRLIIDLNEGHVAVGERRFDVNATDPDAILTNYLALLYSLRGLPVGTPIPLRNVDLTVLSDALGLASRDVSMSLGHMMSSNTDVVREHARGLHRRLVVPVAGILVGLTAFGGLLLVRSDGAGATGNAPAGSTPAVGASAQPPVDVGDAVVLERTSSSDTGATQVVRNG